MALAFRFFGSRGRARRGRTRMREAEGRGEIRVGAWLGGLGAVLAVFVTLAATLWLGFPGGTRLSPRCVPGNWEGALAEASVAATRDHPTLALRCAYPAFLDAEAAGGGGGPGGG